LLGEDLIIYSLSKNKNKSRLGIYGDGDSAYELISTLRFSDKYQIKLIFDEKITNWGRYLHGVKIKSPKSIKESIKNIDIIVIALKSKTDSDKIRDIFKKIEQFNLPIYIYEQNTNKLESSKSKINSLRPLKVEDLLGRSINYDNFPPFKDFIKDTNVLITGAGGSIGSEVCRQILKLKPKKLIILEISEISLYNISQEIQKNNIHETTTLTILGSACDYNLVF